MKVSSELIEKYNVPVPRYTSYPPANHFTDAVSEADYLSMVEQSNENGDKLIAFYIHVPFCKKICFYCGCNACTIRGTETIESYFQALHKEIDAVIDRIDPKRQISQIHFGGGTPNAVDVKYLSGITGKLLGRFKTIANPEIAIECNPAYLDFEYIDALFKAGFNRFSLGIQDFDLDVLKGVNRQPSVLPVEELVAYLKKLSPANSVNLDFIYGLPGQTVEGFAKTIKRAASIKPDRLVTFSYAHVPWMKKHQTILEKRGLPSPDVKMEMFLKSREILQDEAYVAIGLDHYVLPDDELNKALQNHILHRNFQGYCTKRTTGQVYAFGVSAISQLDGGYVQNVKETEHYEEMLKKGQLPVEKGYLLSKEESIVKDVITAVMCNDRFDLVQFAEENGLTLNKLIEITGFDDTKLMDMLADELVTYQNNKLEVSEKGRLFIRNLAVIFDPAFKDRPMQYSKTV